MGRHRWLVTLTYLAPFCLFVAVYAPRVGHGFIQDDYVWILQSTSHGIADLADLFRSDNGFYRPVVALTFAANEWMFGAEPLGYGLTNVLLAGLCALAIGRLGVAFGLPRGAATLAAAMWLLNFHGIRMAVLWVSGRTALVLTLAAVLSATALVRGRGAVSIAWLVVALFAKEEAVLLPIILLGWLAFLQPWRGKASWILWIGGAFAAELVYLTARAMTDAMLPGTAPLFYRFVFNPIAVAENIVSYADRVATFPVLLTLLLWAILGRPGMFADSRTRTMIRCAALWVVGAFGLTVFLPTRSDLYACLPAVGTCLIAAAVCGHFWKTSAATARSRALVVALGLCIILGPVYHLRTERWVSTAELATTTLADLERETASLQDGAHVVITDDRSQRINLGSAFGTLLNEAYALKTGRRLNLWIEPPPPNIDAAGLEPPCATCVDLRLWLTEGRLQQTTRLSHLK